MDEIKGQYTPGGCFVAFLYKNPSKLQTFRAIRDLILKMPLGENLVDFYYNISPELISTFGDHALSQFLIKKLFFEPFYLFSKLIKLLPFM